MKKYFYAFICFMLTGCLTQSVMAQGCVAVKNMSSCSMEWGEDPKGFQFSLNYRYFRSYKHFRGREEEEHRVKEGTEVINHDNSVLVGVSYTFNKRWSAAATIPYMDIDRSSLYEHYGNPTTTSPTLNPRFHTQSRGLGDVRISSYFSAVRNQKFNLTVGLGFKLPTGNYNTKDYFHKKGSEGQDTLVYRVVDQSIQLGDGGFGYIAEFDVTHIFNAQFSAYSTGLYLFNPRNTNGIERSATLTSGIPRSNEFSVADQFLFRLGARYHYKHFQFAAGGRYEGIPSEDLIGKSEGFRRPGYIISLEPSVAYATSKHSIGINFPIALERNRTQNTIDKERTKQTDTYTIGDAAFADWLVSVSYTYKLSK
jgi:hypothetical protein